MSSVASGLSSRIAPAPLRAQRFHAERRVEVGRERLAARRHDDEQRQLGRVATQPRQDVERVLRGVVQIVEPHQDRAVARDSLEDPLDDAEPELRAVEHEALARGTHGRQDVRGRRPQPLGGGGDPRERVVVVLRDLPPDHERLLDGRAVGARQAEVLVDRAGDAGERRGRAAVARAERDHHAALVRLGAQPLGDAALADAGFADEGEEVLALRAARHELDGAPELAALFLPREEHGRAQAQDARRERARVAQRGGVRARKALHDLLERRRVRRPDSLPRAPRVGRELEAVPRLLLEEPQHELAGLRRHVVAHGRRRNGRPLVRAKDVLRVALEDLAPARTRYITQPSA